MSAHSTIESISSLATIPRPLDPENGKIALASVSTFTKSKKRKTAEIAACVDGEAINIYSAQSSRLTASYAVPPQTKFLSSPCSLLLKDQCRRTYFVSANTSEQSAASIVCFQDQAGVTDAFAKRELQLDSHESKSVALIDAVNNFHSVKAQDQPYEVIILRESGSLQSFSVDLSAKKWSANILADDSLDILHAVITTAPKIQKTFLQSREDVNAQIESLASGSEKTLKRINILCTVSRVRDGTDMFVSLTAFRPYGEAQSELDSYILPLVTWKLPEHPEGVSARLDLQCCFNLPLGLVHVATSETIATYDFTHPVPKIMSILSDQRSSILGQIALPGGTLLTASRAGYVLYDVKFNSILDQRYSGSEISQQKKRKRDMPAESHVDVQVVDYYSDLGLVAILRGRELSCIQVAKPRNSKQANTSCLLADALGKGINTTSHPKHIADENIIQSLGYAFADSVTFPAAANWNAVMEQLGDLVEKEEVNEFERLFANNLGISYDIPKQNGVNGTSEHHPSLQWKFPDPRKNSILAHRQRAISALRFIFSWEDRALVTNGNKSPTPSSPLSIQFFPPNTFHWLVITGQLNRSNLDHAFRLYPSDADSTPALSLSSVVDAIVQFDPSLQLLFSVINHHPRLEIPELVQSIKYIIQSLTESAPTLALTNGDHSEANGDNHSIDEEADEAMDDVDFVISTLENGIPMRGEALRRILTQLNAFSNREIAESFRQLLSQSDIVRLMNILRLELEDSGWISRYIDPDPTAAEFGVPSNHAISIISKILSSAVDAIGVSGWLAPSNEDSEDPIDELLLALRAETSIVLEGIHEATFMVDMLDQFLHYAEKKGKEFTPNARIAGAIKTIGYQSPDLPLGLGLHSELSLSRMSVGGRESHRSKRDIGRQISMRIPKYSFDRIRI